MVKLGNRIRVLVDGAGGTSEKAGTILHVVRIGERDSFLTDSISCPGGQWYFGSHNFVENSIELVDQVEDESRIFNIKRLKALKKSAKEFGWVQLGLGDIDMLDKAIALMEKQ